MGAVVHGPAWGLGAGRGFPQHRGLGLPQGLLQGRLAWKQVVFVAVKYTLFHEWIMITLESNTVPALAGGAKR